MKQITQNSIINIDENLFDGRFLFNIPADKSFSQEVDMSKLLMSTKNESLDYKKDYKLWSEVYSPKDELNIFTEIFEDAVSSGKKIHISNISLVEEIDMAKDLYLKLGYFNEELNCFQIDFKNAPVTIGVNINNVIYSFKDYKELNEKILFVPPPREPRHQKAIKSAINS
jgi:dihydroorotase-like cyclic amidohydrolase